MLNQYVNLSPQQRMAQMLQQQQQQTQLQGAQQPMQQAQNPMGGAADAMSMYNKMNQSQSAQDMQDYMARLKLGQSATGGMFDSANAQAPAMTANNYTG